MPVKQHWLVMSSRKACGSCGGTGQELRKIALNDGLHIVHRKHRGIKMDEARMELQNLVLSG